MKAKPASFYDEAISKEDSGHLLEWRRSPYAALYAAAAAMVRTSWVIDLGCGSGRFAKALWDTSPVPAYLGVDFSEKMIEEAQRHTENCVPPTWEFQVADITKLKFDARGATYVILETLEHLEDDCHLLDSLPKGVAVVLSVPSFDSASHVRKFPHDFDALYRYECYVDFKIWKKVMVPGKTAFFHLMKGTVR